MQINSFKGIRNTAPPRSIPNQALADAVDIDIDISGDSGSGMVTQRNGYAQAKVLTNVTSAYSTQDKVSYVVANGLLQRIEPDLSLIPLTPSTATEFADYGKLLFTNDGFKIQDTHVTDLKIPVPSNAADIYAASGTWPSGTYSVTYCYKNASGLEGATAPISTLTLPEDSSIVVIPPPVIAGYTAVIYVTDADGSVYYTAEGIPLFEGQILANPFPAGLPVIAYHDSSVWAASPLPQGNTVLRYSNPFYPHLWDYVNNYLIVPGEVRAMYSVPEGLLIGADAAIYLYAEGLSVLANYGVPKGRAFCKQPDGRVTLFTNRGVCRAMPFENLTETKALFAPGSQCSTALVDQKGIQKFVVLTDASGVPYNVRY